MTDPTSPGHPTNVVNLEAVRPAIDPLRDEQGTPHDMAKLAVWRKGLPQPTTFVVLESIGRSLIRQYEDACNGGYIALLTFSTYPDPEVLRRSKSSFRSDDVVGVTLEYSPLSAWNQEHGL